MKTTLRNLAYVMAMMISLGAAKAQAYSCQVDLVRTRFLGPIAIRTVVNNFYGQDYYNPSRACREALSQCYSAQSFQRNASCIVKTPSYRPLPPVYRPYPRPYPRPFPPHGGGRGDRDDRDGRGGRRGGR